MPADHPADRSKGLLQRGGLLAISSQAIKLFLQLGSMAFLARMLTPEEFGLWSLVMPIVAFFFVFRDVGLTAATIYSDDITDAEVTSLFWINATAGVVLALLVLISAPLASAFYEDARLKAVLSAMAVTFVFNGLSAQYLALFQRAFRFKALAAIDAGSYAVGTFVGLLAAFAGWGYWSLILIPIVTQAANLAAAAVISTWQPGRPRWEKRTLTMARFGSEIASFNFLNYFSRNIDNLLIGKYWGLEALGYYGRAYSLMMAPITQVIYPLNQVVVPVLTRINDDKTSYARTYLGIMRVVMLICAPVVTWLLVSREWVIDILLGAQWQQAASIYLALGFSALVQPMNNSAGWLMLSQGRSRDVLVWGIISAVLTVGSILLGLPWGALGVAISYSIGQIVIITPILWCFACRNQMVRATSMLMVALPFWLASAAAGISFETFNAWWLRRDFLQLPAIAGLGISFVWVIGIAGLLLMLHRSSREALMSVIALVRTFLVRHLKR